ncbi:M50 family metalloprotease [Natronomonas pharaonis DSM 2160]|uniref:M50 family metalloprotease n=1 Tax=Natronomonas pharaonis (strain ATCC 35678 / DSM 2160 / CIP 103997 / JCM 8858 / NBRC 14720 / NCIMB 2260 / Gabara) TaxID=348780 RepID=A0A1U7EWI2_NATPD|nr:Zn-dependent protease [Natronomonas pharaonis]CAI49443.1 M50 family metalloprotease [Natronomonas pharaonis DSM 2160]
MTVDVAEIRFSEVELRDLAIAWVALGVAFSIFIFVATGRDVFPDITGAILSPQFATVFVLSLVTVGVGFLLHELAHKVVAIRFGQAAAFRADYPMLALCVGAAFAGFLFAAPGAVHHRGRITPRENGLISVAGPVTNIVLVGVFLPLVFVGGFVGAVGQLGVIINAFLAAFNMIPFGPLDGKSVLAWSKPVFGAVFTASVLLAVGSFLFVGFPSI